MDVVVLGAGYAGVAVARRLERRLPDDATLVLVDRNEYHLLLHELHRVVRYPALASELQIPLDRLVADSTEVRQATVLDVDSRAGVVTLDEGELEYDLGVVCLGTATEFSGLPGVEAHATPLKTLDDAARIRREFLEATPDARVIVGGAGLSGIQIAGELATFARDRATTAEVHLLERRGTVAPGFPPSFQEAVRAELERQGVAVHTNTTVRRASADAVELDRSSASERESEGSIVEANGAGGTADRLAYDQFVWTGGIRGPPALGGDRVTVADTLRLDERTFAVGDAARVIDRDGQRVPASAQAAVREAEVAAENVARLATHDADADRWEPRLERFRFDARGWVVSVGDRAVAKLGPTVLRGKAARAAKASVDASYLFRLGAVRHAARLVRAEVWAGDGGP